jgi:hypothetical protein
MDDKGDKDMQSTFRVVQGLVGIALALPLLASACDAQNPPPAKVATSAGIEVGKRPFLSVATVCVCGPLEADYPFDPLTYGKVRGYAPVNTSKPPLVLYTRDLNEKFFRLATALDALAAKSPHWSNSLVMVMDEKGAQYGGYTAEEVVQRRERIRQLAKSHNITHLSFFLTAVGAKAGASRLELMDSQNMLLATLNYPDSTLKRAVVGSVVRLASGDLTAQKCQEMIAALAAPVESKLSSRP